MIEVLSHLEIISVSIPKRVSEVLWHDILCQFPHIREVSIPKRVSEVLWLPRSQGGTNEPNVSIPKRVSEVLWPALVPRIGIISHCFNP